ncbi:MAG: UDP-N-acetylmuramoyl-L-alanyl-D-glutamate--2,6-diaminopimelate ligase [Aquisalimonadaceae bacterium]
MMAATRQAPALPLSSLLASEVAMPAEVDPLVTGMTADSRQVEKGWIFAACRGAAVHGLDYLPDALTAGAAAILWEPEDAVDAAQAETLVRAAGVPLVAVPELSRKLGLLASRLHREPSADLTVIGVTGTDGKTSVTQFIAQALAAEGQLCGLIGTLGYGLHGRLTPGANTTPDAARVQALLAGFRDSGADFASMEVSSHALDQHRVAGVRFRIAVLTNLGRDHLDYHLTEQAYAAAKRRLFESEGLACAVLNLDDAFGCSMRDILAPGVLPLGYSASSDSGAEITVRTLEMMPEGLKVAVNTPVGMVAAEVPVMGHFNAQNLLAATAVLVALGWDAPRISRALAAIRPVSGRMECFGGGERPLVVVDYAHTAGALKAALQALREHVSGRIWCVFGCGGDRDSGKRPLMAAVAEANADHLIITDDNPRREDPDRIIADIKVGLRRQTALVERDRAAAIGCAIGAAGAGDAVLVAGKGHENYQVTADGVHHYSDRETVIHLLEEARP